MKKYKIEMTLASIFLTILTVLLWDTLSGFLKYLPLILMLFFIASALATLLPLGQATGESKEKYAPIFYAKSILSSFLGIAIILGIAVILNKNNFSKNFDLTTNKINSLSEESTKFLNSLTKDVQIFCVGAPNTQDNYCSENNDILNLYSKNSKHILNAGPVSLTNKEIIRKIQPSGFSRLVLFTDENKSELEGSLTESKLTNALVNLIKIKKVVYFLDGSGEPTTEQAENSKSYADVVTDLKAKAYNVKSWNIKEGPLPEDARVVIAGDNTIPYNETTETMLTDFVGRGGKLILSVNPFKSGGLKTFYSKIGLKLEENLLTTDLNSPLGQQIAKQNLSRPPVVASNFSNSNPITKVYTQMYGNQSVMLVDGARPIFIDDKNSNLKVKINTETILSSFAAAPIHLTDEKRNHLDLNKPFLLSPDKGFDSTKSWPMAVDVNISEASKLLSTSKIQKMDGNKLDKSEVIVFGFGLVSPYSKNSPSSEELLPLAVAHLYEDQELISIPAKDFKPKNFNLARNPGAFILLFAGLLPLLTATTGLMMWMKRRSA